MAGTESIDHLSTLLDSKDINEKTTAITALNQLSTLNETIIEEIIEKGVHRKLMMLLRAWRNDEDEEDMVEGEEDDEDDSKPKEKLPPPLINEVLNTISSLVVNPDFFDDVPGECFNRVGNILKDDKYQKECQRKVYRALTNAGEQDPEILNNIADDLSLKLPDDNATKKAFLSFIGTLIAAIDDATYPQTVVKSENEFLKEIVAMIDKDGGDELVKMNVFDILWNLCHQYVNYELYYGDDDDDDDEDEEDEDDDLKDKEKEKAEKKKKKEEEVVLCKKYYDWMGKYHDKCIKFVSSLLTEKHFKDIQDEVNKLFTTISDDMSGKLEAKKDKNKDENKEDDKINKKKKKKTKNAAVTTELMKKWSVIHTNLSDKIQTIQLSFNLLKGIFESNDEMISKPKDNEDKNEDKEEKENEEMDDEQLKKMKKTIISSKCRNEMVGMINDHWINNNFDTKKLLEISENVGIEIGDEIDAKLKEVKLDSINLIYEFMSESIISLSNSQWQSLWNFGCKLFHDDNEQSKKDIPLRQKHNEKLMANSQKDDDGKEENKNEMDQDDMDDIDGLDDHFSNRDDMQIGYLLLEAIKKCKDLKITPSQIDDLMNIHKRIRNCQSMATKHSIEYLENPQVFLPIDLIYVDDMNQFGVYINDTLKELFKNEIVKKDKDRQRSILNGLYEDCQVLAENRKFISGLIKYYKEVKDKKKEYKAEDGSSLLESHLIEWNGGDASQVGFDTCQIILDIMSDDQYAKLTMNKRNFESILKNYKQYQEEWKKLKVIVDEYNKTVDAENNKKDNKNKDEDNDEYEFEDGGYNKIIWEEIDCISKPADECITNINKFLKEVN